MSRVFRKWVIVGISVMVLLLSAAAVHASPILPVSNFDFTSYAGMSPKTFFMYVKPTDWGGANGTSDYIFIDSPGAFPCATCADGNFLKTYGPFPNPPVPGNYVQADGDPGFGTPFYQSISGLTPGETYSLSFYQAGTQAFGFDECPGPCITTTEQWLVSLGTSVLTIQPGAGGVSPLGGHYSTYSNADPLADIQFSPLMTTAPMAVTPWNLVTLNLTASAATNILSFMAWGNGGSTGNSVNLPPMVFLIGANIPTEQAQAPVPEPASIALLGMGLAGLGAKQWRKRLERRRVA